MKQKKQLGKAKRKIMLIFCNPYFHERIADRCLIWEERENLSAYQKLD